MHVIFFLVLRRMRVPILMLIAAYATAVLGMVLIPGVDAAGQPTRMDFFHAFYFVSYTATTIGFGELPHPFSEAQRLWVTFVIYVTVIVWIYSIGKLIALSQDPAFRRAVTERRFVHRVAALREPFFLVCGYGETGSALVASLTDRDQRATVVEIREDRVSILEMENLRQFVPALCADAARPVHLIEAGLNHPNCAGVVSLTNRNDVNLMVAITSKLLNPSLTVICRADSRDFEENMESFGTDHIVDPFDTFASHLAMAVKVPGLYLLHEWLTGERYSELAEPIYPPKGTWLLCGFGRFGKAVYARLVSLGIPVTVIEADPALTEPPPGSIVGRGTEAHTLQEAGIGAAVAVVAGTDDDANNLSIVMTARELKPGLFVVARQNARRNQPLFNAVHAAMVMHPSQIIANHIRVLLGTPLLYRFMALACERDEQWACVLISRITAVVSDRVPEVWELAIDVENAFAVADRLGSDGAGLSVGHLMLDPRDREESLPCIPLLVVRARGGEIVVPPPDLPVELGDRLLFCGTAGSSSRMAWTLQNTHALSYVTTGESQPQGLVWRQLRRLSARVRAGS